MVLKTEKTFHRILESKNNLGCMSLMRPSCPIPEQSRSNFHCKAGFWRPGEAVLSISSAMNIPQVLWACFNHPPQSLHFPSPFIYFWQCWVDLLSLLYREVVPPILKTHLLGFFPWLRGCCTGPPNTSQCIKTILKIVPQFRRTTNFKRHASRWKEGLWVQVRLLPKQSKCQGPSSTDLPLLADG